MIRRPLSFAFLSAVALSPLLGSLGQRPAVPDPAQRRRFPQVPPIDCPVNLVASPSSPLVAVRFQFAVGSADDPPGKEGLAALTAALVSQGGTRSLTYEQVLTRFLVGRAHGKGAK